MIDSYYTDNPQALVRHHVESYNDFYKSGIFQIFKEKNPIILESKKDEKTKQYRSKCILYLGGKDGSKIYFGKPVIYDDNDSHYMFPNEARLRNMTYAMSIHYDVDVEFVDDLEPGELPMVVLDQKGGYTYVDQAEEHDDADDENPKNFKEDKFQEAQEQENVERDDGQKKISAGAPEPIRKRKTTKKILDVTPAETARIKETTAKSMTGPNTQTRTMTLEKVYLGKFPIMLQSDYCVLSGLSRDIRFNMGECRNDLGGYFIIDGKEKTVVAQEKFADNMLYIRDVNDEDYLYSAEIRSVSENVSKPIRTLSVKIVTPSKKFTNNRIVVNIPNVRMPVPLFIVFRALGVLSDKDIITMCLLDLEKYDTLVDLFIPSVHDAAVVMTQREALNYIRLLTKGKTYEHALEILSDYFLPHVGETNFTQKAYYLGHIVFRLLSVHKGLELPTDRDNFKYKRIELVGSLMHDLFREYYTIQQRHIYKIFEEQLYYKKGEYENNLFGLIRDYNTEAFREKIVERGFRTAFKGNWGAQTHTKRIGVVQDLNRLSFNSALSHLRKTNLPLDASVKLVGPRVLHGSQWGFFDPIDTPDGGNIGLHKSLSISAQVTQGYSREHIIKWMREKVDMKLIEDCSPAMLSAMSKVMVNGLWAGSVTNPFYTVEKMKLFRRNALLPIYTSITFEIKSKTIFIYTDAGRICRPVLYRDNESGKFSFDEKHVVERLTNADIHWDDLVTGFNEKKVTDFDPYQNQIYELHELYQGITTESNPAKLERFIRDKAILDYIDSSESENAYIAMNNEALVKDVKHRYTHMEIHESLIFGMMCNMIIFPENNPATRNSFSCGQSKQAVSMYHTNHQVRMDKTAVVLVSGQVPLVKSRYLEHINHEENPYGENAIVAIMCYTGYNVEDAILINEGALKRGLFRTTYYSTYESHEEKTQSGDGTVETVFTNVENETTVIGTKPGYDYSKLDKYGMIRENTPVDDKTVLIGLTATSSNMKDTKMDMSKTPKKGQLGIVDKSFITEGEEGKRIAKVRVREMRIPNLGDKMASRSGQKGTIGLVIPEEDMPFTKDGIRPDMIINPHALPSRMTIGQLVECIIGKAAAHYGAYSDCTAFVNKGSKIGVFGELLPKVGFHSSGNEILYNGMTGQQLETEIFIGPTYYMRLKHMVKDKINYRALGPRTALTKQPVSGRANDGGLRIGEMERDSVISHGAVNFLTESMMERGDKYHMAVCNKTGMVAIYNPSKNLFMSPMADGPIKFVGTMDGMDSRIANITKFGRSFSIVRIPYTLKLLMQELQTINIQMRLITEDNIDQFENMTYSKNIENLLFEPGATAEKVVNNTKLLAYDVRMADKHLRKKMQNRDQNQDQESNPDLNPRQGEGQEPNVPDGSPLYVPDGSPPYIPMESPEYIPGSNSQQYGVNSSSPVYIQNSSSPGFDPTNPEQYIKGGQEGDVNIPETFEVGEPVHLRGDVLPQRLWSITKLGDRFITIDTQDPQGLTDTIKVVTSFDLYKPGDFSYDEQMAPPIQYKSNIATNDQAYPTTSHGGTPAIHFAPVFKILNGGNDFSNETAEPSTSPANMNESYTQNGQQNEIIMGPNIGGNPIPIQPRESAPSMPKQQESNEVDFSNLVIKKV